MEKAGIDDLREHWRNRARPEGSIFTAAGNIDPRSLADQLNIVGEIIDLQTRLKAWDAHCALLDPRLGRRFRGRESNWESILTDVEITDQLLDNSIVDWSILVNLLTNDDAARQSQEIVRRFDEACTISTLIAYVRNSSPACGSAPWLGIQCQVPRRSS